METIASNIETILIVLSLCILISSLIIAISIILLSYLIKKENKEVEYNCKKDDLINDCLFKQWETNKQSSQL